METDPLLDSVHGMAEFTEIRSQVSHVSSVFWSTVGRQTLDETALIFISSPVVGYSGTRIYRR